jgi:hypothetical protein
LLLKTLISMPRIWAFASITAILGLFSCSNDFELVEKWKEIPVAYGILNVRDTAHYVRVEKGFVDPERSALQIARIPDSLYYPDNQIAVFIVRARDPRQKFRLTRVDGTREGFRRQDGIFATQPNWLYKLRRGLADSIKPGETYRLVIERNDGKPPITAETTMPRDFQFRVPNPADIPPFITFRENETTRIEWRADVNAVFHNVNFVIRYREEDASGVVLSRNTLRWTAVSNVRRTEDVTNALLGQYRAFTEIAGATLFNFLAQNISASTTRFRVIESLDLVIEGGGKEIESLLETSSANAGLTGAEIINTYTNLSEGYGIFTGKIRTQQSSIRVTPQTIDALRSSPITRPLNFKQ